MCDNFNGTELCGRTILCDHIKQYKIPKEYMYLSDSDKEDKDKKKKDDEEEKEHSDVSSESSDAKEAKAKEKWEKKLYKPTGPDG